MGFHLWPIISLMWGELKFSRKKWTSKYVVGGNNSILKCNKFRIYKEKTKQQYSFHLSLQRQSKDKRENMNVNPTNIGLAAQLTAKSCRLINIVLVLMDPNKPSFKNLLSCMICSQYFLWKKWIDIMKNKTNTSSFLCWWLCSWSLFWIYFASQLKQTVIGY